MTVKELKEKLNEFDDRLLVYAIDGEGYTLILNVTQGCNEADGCLFLDGYEEDVMSCDYCEKGALLVSASSWHSSKGDFYPGISVGIDGDELWIEATPDTYEPGYMEDRIKINFCPMCGTRLSEENL